MLQENNQENQRYNTNPGVLATESSSGYYYYDIVCTSGSAQWSGVQGLSVSDFDPNTICIAYFDRVSSS